MPRATCCSAPREIPEEKEKLNSKNLGQNLGLVWSSDPSLWGNQILRKPKFWTEPRACMVLGLKPMGKPSNEKKSKFKTEPRRYEVLGLKPFGKSTARMEKSLGSNTGKG